MLIFFIGNIIFALGITITIKVQHLGLHPWDVLSVGLYEKFGLSIGSWNIIVGILLVSVSLILDRTYVRVGTLFNVILIGSLIDLYLWLDFLPNPTYTWLDSITIIIGIVLMGIGGGIYNGAGIGSGPRDGFMLSISDKTGISIRKVRIITETLVLVIGWIIGGPVFIFTFIFTFIQSPIFQYVYLRLVKYLEEIELKHKGKRSKAI